MSKFKTHDILHPTTQPTASTHGPKPPRMINVSLIYNWWKHSVTIHRQALKDISITLSSHLSFNHEGRWGTTDDFTTRFLHFSLFSTARWDLANSRPVHSLMLSSHLLFCLPCLLPLFTVPCKMVWARPDWISCSIHKILWKLAYLVLSKLRFSFKDIKWSGNLPISV